MQTSFTFATVVPSMLRTLVPVGVGSLLSLLVTTGVLPTPLPAEATDALVTAVVAITIGLYYTIMRLAEQRWPWVSVLLGSRTQPAGYARSKAVVNGDVVAGEVAEIELDTLDGSPEWADQGVPLRGGYTEGE